MAPARPTDRVVQWVYGDRIDTFESARYIARAHAAKRWLANQGTLDVDVDAKGFRDDHPALVGARELLVNVNGVDQSYPSRHNGLLTRTVEAGAVLSEIPSGQPPTR